MQSDKRPITVELAGVSVEILCRFPENCEFLLPYRTEKEPAFTVEITPEDDAFSIAHLTRYFEEQARLCSGAMLENISTHCREVQEMKTIDALKRMVEKKESENTDGDDPIC